jgi:2-polyprenyl-3-methyl-5-hydroxy-6-metoxy-1,4-benzoquinol methylase
VDNLNLLRSGTSVQELVRGFLASEEFTNLKEKPTFELPNLLELHPFDYRVERQLLYIASDEKRINRMEQFICNHSYHDRPGILSPVDSDKRNMAQLLECFGAKTCLQVGCANGPILNILSNRGVDVNGVDQSRFAFRAAFSKIRDKLIYGNLLTAKIYGKYDCILLVDVLQKVNPLRVGQHICRLRDLLAPDGVIIVNGPMFGTDPMFGIVFPQYVEEWGRAGDDRFFQSWPCDDNGWPIQGYMSMASPTWWTTQFASKDLARIEEVEACIHHTLEPWFSWAPARKSLFVLRHRQAKIDVRRINASLQEKNWKLPPPRWWAWRQKEAGLANW